MGLAAGQMRDFGLALHAGLGLDPVAAQEDEGMRRDARRAKWFVGATVCAWLLGATAAPAATPPRLPHGGRVLLRRSNWVRRNDNGMVYDTTKHSSDLDRAVTLGARILKYRSGAYVHAIHKQYPSTCGPATLAMVLKQLGITDPPPPRGSLTRVRAVRRRVSMPRDVDLIASRDRVDVGRGGTPEHLLWLGLHRKRLELDASTWNRGYPPTDGKFFMDRNGLLDTRSSGVAKSRLAEGRNMDYLTYTTFPRWLWKHPGVGYGGRQSYATGLPGIMNYIYSGGRTGPWRDAMPLGLHGRNAAEVVAYRRIIKGFIDHNISLVCGVDNAGHFNALIGYSGAVSPATAAFYVYTADPLDGWGRAENRQPLRWRRMSLVAANLRSGTGLLSGIVCWNHHAAGGVSVQFRRSGWATTVDRQNGNSWLTGADRKPLANDPLSDRLSRRADRTP